MQRVEGGRHHSSYFSIEEEGKANGPRDSLAINRQGGIIRQPLEEAKSSRST
jgi:hypothetical protein